MNWLHAACCGLPVQWNVSAACSHVYRRMPSAPICLLAAADCCFAVGCAVHLLLQAMSEEEEEEEERRRRQQEAAARGYPYEPAEPHGEGGQGNRRPACLLACPSGICICVSAPTHIPSCCPVLFCRACHVHNSSVEWRISKMLPLTLYVHPPPRTFPLLFADRPRPRRLQSVAQQLLPHSGFGGGGGDYSSSGQQRTRLNSVRGGAHPRINLNKLQTAALKRYGAVHHLVSGGTCAGTACRVPAWPLLCLCMSRSGASGTRVVALCVLWPLSGQKLAQRAPWAVCILEPLVLVVPLPIVALTCHPPCFCFAPPLCAARGGAAGVARAAVGSSGRALCGAAGGGKRGHLPVPLGRPAPPHGPAALMSLWQRAWLTRCRPPPPPPPLGR